MAVKSSIASFLYGAKGMCVIRLKYSVIRNNKSNRLVLSFVQ